MAPIPDIIQRIEEEEMEPNWISYHDFSEEFGSNDQSALFINYTPDELPIYVARTMHAGRCVPGYSIDGVGYFVSTHQQIPFQTNGFDVIYTGNYEFLYHYAVPGNQRVANGHYNELPIQIGSFNVEVDLELCGMVINDVCYINYNEQVVPRNYGFTKMPWHNPAHGAYEGSEALVVCPDTFEGNPIPVVRTCIDDELLFGYALGAMGYFTFEYWEDMPPCFRANRNFEMLYEDNLSFVHPEHVAANQNYYNLVEHDGTAMYLGCFPVNGIRLCGELRDGNCSVANYANLTVETNIADYTVLTYTQT